MSEIAVQQTVYLITGANKGIGRAIVAILLQRPDTIVVAGVRFPDDPTCTSLRELYTGKGSKVVVVELKEDKHFKTLGETLKSQGIDHLDVVIANAGNSKGFCTVLETPVENVMSDFEVNTIGTMKLFQACWPLYRPKQAQGGKPRKWIVVTSSLGSIGCLDMESMPCASYGLSKAAVNFMTKKISVEMKDENLAAMCIHPGWVNTEMGRKLAQSLGAPDPSLTPEDSARGCLDYIDNLTIETTGKFLYYDGRELPW